MISKRQVFTSLMLTAATMLAPVFMATTAAAETVVAPASSPKELQQTNAIHLAYIRSNSSQVNSDAQTGLENLSAALNKKTAVKAQGVTAIDLEKDDISFFRFLYWPVTPDAQPLSDKARQRVQQYIDKGGVILFDLRDAGGQMHDQRAIRRVLADINIKPLVQLPQDHTLTRTFYKSALPGSTSYGDIWVETQVAKGTEAVSSAIIGNRNWGDAWAGKTVLTGTPEHEMALRAGINMVLYAYTGNFKADPVQKTLERLNQ